MKLRARQRKKLPFWLLGAAALIEISLLISGFTLVKAWIEAPPAELSESRPTGIPSQTVAPATNKPGNQIVDVSVTPAFTKTPLPTPTLSATKPPSMPTDTSTPRPTESETEVPPTPIDTRSPSPTATRTQEPPTPTDTPSPSATATATGTPSPSPTATIALAQLSGRLLLNGTPVANGAILALEDAASQVKATQSVDQAGRFSFSGLVPSADGYQVTFAQSMNESYEDDQVMSWAWIGPISTSSGMQVDVGDLEIGLLGLEPIQPLPDSSIGVATISSGSSLIFEWTAYPQAERYWLDLTRTDQQGQQIVWQSGLVAANTLPFDGTLSDGSKIPPGDYGWAVGAQSQVTGHSFVVYGYLAALQIVP